MNIYELTGKYKNLENACLLNADDESLKSEFDKIKDDLKLKAENYAKIIKNLEAEAKGYSEEAKRLSDRQRSLENRVKILKNDLYASMKETGEEKFRTSLFSFSVNKNGGRPALVVDVAPIDLPEEFQKLIVEADKDALREYIEETGDFTYAHIAERGEHLSIR